MEGRDFGRDGFIGTLRFRLVRGSSPGMDVPREEERVMHASTDKTVCRCAMRTRNRDGPVAEQPGTRALLLHGAHLRKWTSLLT